MRHVPARPEQTQSPLSDTDATREREALERQRAHLLIALAAAEQSVRFFLPGSLEHGKAKKRVTILHNELRLMRGRLGIKAKRPDLGESLIQIFRERVTPCEWERIVAEAQRRADAQTLPAPVADFGPCETGTPSSE
ncbi:MAG TPA: hypothetical protein VF573_29950 [Paraburkholderia sp.]|uniref:hypothetical protein n=1 Tax=Paraburkholderia sp. TaxID=1926495 RepID=UPI002ED68EAF